MIIGIPFFERKKSGEVIYELSVIYNVEENIKKNRQGDKSNTRVRQRNGIVIDSRNATAALRTIAVSWPH